MQPALSGMWLFLMSASWLREKILDTSTAYTLIPTCLLAHHHPDQFQVLLQLAGAMSFGAWLGCWNTQSSQSVLPNSHAPETKKRGLLSHQVIYMCKSYRDRNQAHKKSILKPSKGDWNDRMEKPGSPTCIICSFSALLHKRSKIVVCLALWVSTV